MADPTCAEPRCTTTRQHHTHTDADGRSWCCGAYPYTAPGGDRAEAREQIAREVADRLPAYISGVAGDIADAVLATPAVAEALAAREALRRVREFVDGFAERGGGHVTATDELWIMSIRRRLDGHP